MKREQGTIAVLCNQHAGLVAALREAAVAMADASHYLPDDEAIELNGIRERADAALALADKVTNG